MAEDLLVFGLGNPGSQYERTRHNVGFLVVSRLAESAGLRLRRSLLRQYRWAVDRAEDGRLILVEPLTYMNRSGDVLPGLMKRFRTSPTRLLVVCDTLDLSAGTCRMKRNGSSAGHRGLASVIDRIGTTEFPRLYLGIGRPERKKDVVSYVLEVPDDTEAALIERCIKRSAEAVERLRSEPLDTVLNWYNSADHA